MLYLTESEFISYLKRTRLPTVVVEGTSDAQIYRWLESRLDCSASVFAVGGRSMLLNIFKRRDEFINTPIVFLADQDMWLFSGIPDEYSSGIVFTSGYSIENDLYAPMMFECLLSKDEKSNFERLIDRLCRWFGSEVTRYLKFSEARCDFHIDYICPDGDLNQEWIGKYGFFEPDDSLLKLIRSNYDAKLRGRNLLQALLRYLSSSKRLSKFSLNNLLEMGAKLNNSKIDGLCDSLRKPFHIASNGIAS